MIEDSKHSNPGRDKQAGAPEPTATLSAGVSLPPVPDRPIQASIIAQGDVLYSGVAGMALGRAIVLPVESAKPGNSEVGTVAASIRVDQECQRLGLALKVLQSKYPEDVDPSDPEFAMKLVAACLVRDPDFGTSLAKIIKENGVDAVAAVRDRCDQMTAKVKGTQNQRNADDFRSVCDELIDILQGQHVLRAKKLDLLRHCQEPTVLIAKSVSPTETGGLDPKNLKAMALENPYDYDSHVCLGAQSRGIPALCRVRRPLGTPLTETVKDGDLVLIDARAAEAFARETPEGRRITGNIIVNPSPALVAEYERRLAEELGKPIIPLTERYTRTADFEEVRLRGVVSNINALDRLVAMRVQGVALVRTEMLLIDHSGKIADEAEQIGMYMRILRALNPNQGHLRTFDIRPEFQIDDGVVDSKSQEVLAYLRRTLRQEGREGRLENDWEEIFEGILRTQLRCMLTAHQRIGNARIFFPMIEDPQDVERKLAVAGEQWGKLTGLKELKVDMGAMIETGRGVDEVSRIAPLVKFLSIGTGDLTNSVLKTHRGVSFVPHHHLVLDKMAHMVEVTQMIREDYRLYVCGPMVQPYYAPVLNGLGLNRWAVNTDDMYTMNAIVAKLRKDDTKSLVRDMRACRSAEEGKAMLDSFHKTYLSDLNVQR